MPMLQTILEFSNVLTPIWEGKLPRSMHLVKLEIACILAAIVCILILLVWLFCESQTS